MNRRKLLVVGGLATGGGYLAWNWYRSPDLPDGMRVDTLHLRRDVRAEDESETDPLDWKEENHFVVEDGDDAAEALGRDDEAASFLGDLDPEDTYAIVVQTGMQTQPDLVLDAITRTADGIHVDISIDAPRSVDDDLRPHSFLLLVVDERGAIPETVTVAIEGYR